MKPGLTARCRGALVGSALFALLSAPARPQSWDLGGKMAEYVSQETDKKVKVSFEFRSRYEGRTGLSFGKETDVTADLMRTRVGLSYTPVSWLKFSGMMQDSRAPLYGDKATSTVRDSADLQEGYFELFPDSKTGLGMIAGRGMLNYGEGRLIGTPQWSNLARTYDNARIYYRLPKARFDFLFVSPVKIRLGEFNRPVLGDHVWGSYNSFPNVLGSNLLEAYVLRHDQNRPAGFTGGSTQDGTDRLGVNTFGARLTGSLGLGSKYSLEADAQNGKVGAARHRAGALFAGVSHRWKVFEKPFDLAGEYKFASGTGNPGDLTRVGTFDQLYPANHDKFGHQDLFGWRNIQNARSLATLGVTKSFGWNVMYNSYWLASTKDALYNGSGRSIVRSAAGTAGRHVGQDVDTFVTYKYNHLLFGAGCGYFIKGEFIRNTTPGVNPTYVYMFQSYAF